MPQIGDTRVNSSDYGDEIVIEQYSYWNGGAPSWAVPAWEERGNGDLEGPFATVDEARAALGRAEEMWNY